MEADYGFARETVGPVRRAHLDTIRAREHPIDTHFKNGGRDESERATRCAPAVRAPARLSASTPLERVSLS